MPTIRPSRSRSAEGWTLILHSDGMSARIDREAVDAQPPRPPEPLAQAILTRYARASDDAIVVVARSATDW